MEQPTEQEMYRAIFDKEGCKECGHGTMWTVVDKDGIDCGQSFGDKELANDLCELMNMAYERALEPRTWLNRSRCQENDPMCGQCELADKHDGKHLAGMNLW